MAASNLSWTDVKSLFYNDKVERRGKKGAKEGQQQSAGKSGSRVKIPEGEASGEDIQELCWNCASLGHSDATCPIPRRCYVCLNENHEAHQCQSNPVEGSITFNKKETCENCKLLGHAATRCKAEGGALYQRSGLNLSKQTVFSRPLVIKVQEDNGPPAAEVNSARSAVITILERYLNANSEGGDGGEEASVAEGNISALYNSMFSPQQQQQRRQEQESPNLSDASPSGSWSAQPSHKSTYINPGLMSDVEIFQLGMRLVKSRRCKRNEELSLTKNLDVLKRMISSVGIPHPTGGGAGRRRQNANASVAHLLTDDNMLHELKVSNLDFHVVFGGKVEQYHRTRGNEASQNKNVGTKYAPVGGELKPATDLVKQFRYNPEKHGHKATKLRQKLKADQEAREKLAGRGVRREGVPEKVQTKMDLLQYVLTDPGPTTTSSPTNLAASPASSYCTFTDAPSPLESRLEDGKSRLKEAQVRSSGGNNLIPQAPKAAASKKAMSDKIVTQWERHQRVVQNPRQVRSVRTKDTTFSKETFVKTRPMPASWTTGGKDAVASYEEQMIANDVPMDQVELLPPDVVHPVAELEEELREKERRRRKLYGPGDQGDTFNLTRLECGAEGDLLGGDHGSPVVPLASATEFSGVLSPDNLQQSEEEETMGSPSKGDAIGEPADFREGAISPSTNQSVTITENLEVPERAENDPGGITTVGRIPQPPIKNWDVFRTLGFRETNSSRISPRSGRVNAEQYQEAEEESEDSLDPKTDIVVNPIDLTGITQHWKQRFNSSKLRQSFEAQEKLAARSSLRRIAASSNEQLARCAEEAMKKGRQWHVAHGIYRKKSDIQGGPSRPSTARASTSATQNHSIMTPRSTITSGGTTGSNGGSPVRPGSGAYKPNNPPVKQSTSAYKKAAMSNSIWSQSCTHMAEQAVNHQQTQNVYRGLREYLDKIKAPHTHQGHQFVNAFVRYLGHLDAQHKEGGAVQSQSRRDQGESSTTGAMGEIRPFSVDSQPESRGQYDSPVPFGSESASVNFASGAPAFTTQQPGPGFSNLVQGPPSTEVSIQDLERLIKTHCPHDPAKWALELGKIIAFLRTMLLEEG